MVRSAVWGAQDALYALLAAQSGFTGVQVGLGRPAQDQDENVWVSGELTVWDSEYRVSGLGAKDETFTLQVSVLVTRLGGDYSKTRNRVRDLGQIVEDVIAANPTLSGTVELAQFTGGRVSESMVDERRRAVIMTMDVDCRAWLA